ncbi:MAG: hypothetical protein II914_03105 [Clostridia bacterium]|nr:hypothetical protein [Clostridia bacterium]
MSALFDAIANSRKWNDTETRFHYREILDDYRQQHLDACAEEIGKADDPQSLASALLDRLETRWKGIWFFSRSAEKENDKLKAVMFLFPMLLDAEDPACTAFVSALQNEWNTRFPKWTLQAASSETIAGGFRRTILGFKLPEKQ